MSKEIRETQLFLCFMIFTLTVCAIGLTMTTHPPRSWIISSYAPSGTDAYEICKHIVDNKSGQYDSIEFCLHDGSELNWDILQPRIITILRISLFSIIAILLLVRDKKVKAKA